MVNTEREIKDMDEKIDALDYVAYVLNDIVKPEIIISIQAVIEKWKNYTKVCI